MKFDTPEDAWNCFGVDTNKQKDSTTPAGELQEIKNVEEVETQKDEWACLLKTSKLLVEDIDSKTQSRGVEEEDIKCESPKEEFPELIDTEVRFITPSCFFLLTGLSPCNTPQIVVTFRRISGLN